MTDSAAPSGSVPSRPTRPGVPPTVTLELFYDLIFVAAVVVLSDSFSHSPTVSDFGWLAIVFALVWLVWMQTSLLFNLTENDGHVRRFFVLAQMMLIVLAAVSASDGVYEHSEYVGPIYAGILVLLAGMQWHTQVKNPEMARYARKRIIACLIAAVIFVATPLYPDPGYLIPWAIGFFVVLAPSLKPDPLGGRAIDNEHLVERFGAFTIIMLGESFVKTALTSSEGKMEGFDLLCLAGTFAIVFAIWWLYFSNVPTAGLRRGHAGHTAWMMTHLPLHLCIVGIAVGAAKAISLPDSESGAHAIPYLSLPLVGVIVALAALEYLGEQGPSLHITVLYLVTAALVLVVGLVASVLDPEGIEATSVVLAVIMAATVFVAQRIRERDAAAPIAA
ncbi:low temperature requirement protein A [soil metagenome]